MASGPVGSQRRFAPRREPALRRLVELPEITAKRVELAAKERGFVL
jgi:hypothetical protein